MPCCVMPCCAVLYCTVPCRAVLCCAVLCRIVLRSPTWQSLKGPASIPWWLQHAVPTQSQLLLAREEQRTSPEHLYIPG